MQAITSKEEFDKEVIKADQVVMVDFWATWCGPCKMLKKELEKLNSEVKIVTVDVDNCPEIAAKFNITSIPTMLFYNKGELVNQVVGLTPAKNIDDIIENIA